MTTSERPSTRFLDVPGARLHYEIRGDDRGAARRGAPPLVVVGSPMAAAEFAAVAGAMAGDRTVVTLDPRGYAASRLDDPKGPSTPEIRADDVAAIIDDMGARTADVFGSSGGAVTGLALVAAHPERVRTLVAHEPPLLELLPDADAHRNATDALIATFRRDGPAAAWAAFLADAGFDASDGPPPGPEPTPAELDRQLAESARFFEFDLPSTTRYVPDVDALRHSSRRIVVGLGETSAGLLTDATSRAAAALLGTEPALFPGGHVGFLETPETFAERLREVL